MGGYHLHADGVTGVKRGGGSDGEVVGYSGTL